MTRTSVREWALTTCLGVLPLLVGLTGCIGDRYNQSTSDRLNDNLTAASACNQDQDQRIEDRRTAERVREALAAGADYKYDGVKVTACEGAVALSGFVNTSAQRNSAGEGAGKVVGVKSVENNLTVKE
jgi:osmotically-inducible protein OsmY